MVRLDEIVPMRVYNDLPMDYRINITHLHYKVNVLRRLCKIPFHITSGFRTDEQHQRIYKEINDKRHEKGLGPIRIPLSSQHLFGCAVDIGDSNSKIKQWVKAQSEQHLALIGLWYEHFDATPFHLHAQIYPPESGQRFFIP